MFLVFCLFLTSYLPFVWALAAANVLGVNNLTMLFLDITALIALCCDFGSARSGLFGKHEANNSCEHKILF